MSIVNQGDFVGFFAIPQTKRTDLTTWITEFEDPILNDLLGCELANLLRADLIAGSGSPFADRFKDIYNPFCKDICHWPVTSKGIKDMLISMIYMLYLRDIQVNATNAGVQSDDGENLTPNTQTARAKMIARYNNGVKTYKAIQLFICDNLGAYPEYNGVQKQTIRSAT